jgi:hypothetical protein
MNKLYKRLIAMGVTDAAVAIRMIENYKRTGVL